MLNWTTFIAAVTVFGILISVLFQFVNVHPEKKRFVTGTTMGLILIGLFLVSLYGVMKDEQHERETLDNLPASGEPSAPLYDPTPDPSPSPSPLPEPSPTPGAQVPEPAETIRPESPPPEPSPELPASSPAPETPSPVPLPTAAPQAVFLLDAFDDISYTSDDIHLEYRGPNNRDFVLDRFPLELPMVSGYYYVKIHRDGTCRELAQASFYVDDSVAGYAIGFRRILSWGLYDAGEVDKNCLPCSWGYRALPTANLCLTLVDGQQFPASGIEVRVRCEEFDSDVFRCTYLGEPLWFSLPPGYNYSVTVSFDSFTAAEESFQVTAPQDGTSPQTLRLQLA